MIALVTGASSGIGEATARRLAREPGAQLVLVARREERLRALAAELGGATVIPGDLLAADAPARIAQVVESEHGRLDLLVNNAGAAWRGQFGDAGWENVRRHMELNFDATVRLTEALLPLLRRSAPSAIVNVASTAGRVARGNSGAYSASKFALVGWSDALHLEERRHGVHVGMVLPGFVATEGFPQAELRARVITRWMVSQPERVAEAIVAAGPGGAPERYVPRPYWLAAALRILAPRLVRRALSGGGAVAMTPATGPDRTNLTGDGSIAGVPGYTIRRLEEIPDAFGGKYPGTMRFLTGPLDAEQVAVTHRDMPPGSGGKGGYGHRHKTQEEIYFVVSGRLQFKLDDEIVDVDGGGAVRVAPEVARSVWNEGPGDAHLLIFSVRMDNAHDDAEIVEDFWPA